MEFLSAGLPKKIDFRGAPAELHAVLFLLVESGLGLGRVCLAALRLAVCAGQGKTALHYPLAHGCQRTVNCRIISFTRTVPDVHDSNTELLNPLVPLHHLSITLFKRRLFQIGKIPHDDFFAQVFQRAEHPLFHIFNGERNIQ